MSETDLRVPLRFDGYDALTDVLPGTPPPPSPQPQNSGNSKEDTETALPPFLSRTRITHNHNSSNDSEKGTRTCVALRGLQEHVRRCDGTLKYVSGTEDVIYWCS